MIESVRDWVMNKTAASLIVAGTGNIAANMPSKYIDLASSGIGPLTYAGWIAAISCFWIITLILEKYWRWAKELFTEYRARRDKLRGE